MIDLPSGRQAEFQPMKGKHIRQAQKVSGNDQDQFIFALIAQLVTIDGEPIVAEDIDEMDGKDVLALMGEFGGNF